MKYIHVGRELIFKGIQDPIDSLNRSKNVELSEKIDKIS